MNPFLLSAHLPVRSFDMLYEDSARRIYVKDIEDSLYIILPSQTGGNYEIKKRLSFRPEIFQFQEAGPVIYLEPMEGLFVLHKNTLVIEKSAVTRLLPFTSIKNLLVEGNNIWLFGEKVSTYIIYESKPAGYFPSRMACPIMSSKNTHPYTPVPDIVLSEPIMVLCRFIRKL